MTDLLNACIDAVTAASRLCREIQHRLVDRDTLIKKDRSPVTIADFAAQAVVCRALCRRFPDIPVVGEEDALDLARPENGGLASRIAGFLPGWSVEDVVSGVAAGGARPGPLFFTLDPIDGTKGFLRGDQYAVAVALIRNGRVDLGVLGCPNLPAGGQTSTGVICHGRRGGGSFSRPLEGGSETRLSVSTTDGGAVRFLESVEPGHADHGHQARVMNGLGRGRVSVRIDSQAKYAVLAQGGADVYLRLPSPETPDYREKIWDHAAGAIIVEEAGGTVTDAAGKALDFSTGRRLTRNSGVIGTNGRLHRAVLDSIEAADGR